MNRLLYLLPVFMLIHCIYGEDKPQRKIKLEDIERDNLVSERQAQLKESLQEQQALHDQPQSFQTLIQYKPPNSLPPVPSSRGGVVYAKPSSHDEEGAQEQDYEDEGRQLGHLQYTAPTSAIPAKVYGGGPPVHESPRTYAAFSRQTLLKPIAPTAASYLRQQEQPQFVYVQATGHHAPETRNLKQVAAQAHYVDESYGYDDGGQPGLQAPSGPQEEEQVYEQPGGAPNYLQYVPYIARGPADGQSYVMMAPIPAGYQQQAAKQVALAPSAVAYSHQAGGVPPPTAGHLPQGGVQYLTQPTGPAESAEYVGGTGHGGVTATAPGQDIQYADQSHRPSLDKSKQYLFAPKHPEPQILVSRQQQLPKVEYRSSQKVIPLRQTVYSAPQTLQVANVPSVLASRYLEPAKSAQPLYTVSHPPSVDFFHGRDSKSLLDSYIPSWVIIQRQNALQQQNFATPLVGKYNTISYAVPHPISGHYKRDAKGKV